MRTVSDQGGGCTLGLISVQSNICAVVGKLLLKSNCVTVCCAPSMKPPQRMHIASVMKQCSGYELAVIVMNPFYTLPLPSHHNNKDVHKGATL